MVLLRQVWPAQPRRGNWRSPGGERGLPAAFGLTGSFLVPPLYFVSISRLPWASGCCSSRRRLRLRGRPRGYHLIGAAETA